MNKFIPIASLIATTALSGQALSQKAFAQPAGNTVLEIAVRTPGIRSAGTSQLGGVNLTVRGRNALGESGSGGVSIDGILMNSPAALTRIIPDLQSVEILKGPQGRGAPAAAFAVTTRRPDNTIQGAAHASGGNGLAYAVQGSIAGPLVRDKVLFGLTASARGDDGFQRNGFIGTKNVDGATDYDFGGRILLQFDASTLDLKTHWGRTSAGDSAFDIAFALPIFAQFLKRPQFNENINDHIFAVRSNIQPSHHQQAIDLSAKWDQDMSWGLLSAWALYSDVNNDLLMDGAAGIFGTFNDEARCRASTATQFAAGRTLSPPQNLSATPEGSLFGLATSTACDGTHYQVRDQRGVSAEVRLTSPADAKLRWAVGGSVQHMRRHVGVNVGIDQGSGAARALFVPATGTNPTEQLFDDRFTTGAYAAFVELTYDVFRDLAVAAAMRYETEHHHVHNRVPVGVFARTLSYTPGGPFVGGAPLNPALDPATNLTGRIPDQSGTFGQFVPKVGVTWTGVDNLVLYTNWGIGFKPGGFNSLGTAAAADIFLNDAINAGLGITDRFTEEHSSAVAGGFRAHIFGGRITLSGAGYYTRVKNAQFPELIAGPFGMLRAVNTIDKMRIAGGETDVSVQILDGLSVFAGANLQSSKILAMASRPDSIGNQLPYVADYSINGGAQVTLPMTSAISFFGSTDFSLTGPTAFHAIQCQNRPTTFSVVGNTCGTIRKTIVTVDLSAGVRTEAWTIAAYVKNVANSRHVAEAIVMPEVGLSLVRPADLRRMGLDLTYAF